MFDGGGEEGGCRGRNGEIKSGNSAFEAVTTDKSCLCLVNLELPTQYRHNTNERDFLEKDAQVVHHSLAFIDSQLHAHLRTL